MSERIGRDDDERGTDGREDGERERSREEPGQRGGGRGLAGSARPADDDEQGAARDLGSRRGEETGEVF